MKIVKESAEHHFVTALEKLKDNPKGWMSQYYALSRMLAHRQIVSDLLQIQPLIEKALVKSSNFADELLEKTSAVQKGFIYLFSDGDILLLASPENEQEKSQISAVQSDMGKLHPGLCDFSTLAGEFYNFQKLADRKLVSAKCFDAYKVMSDNNKVSSIAARRARRDESKVLIIEDDRFTASYTANILSKEYDLAVCRTGEEGIISYVEQAPDIVFLDIHLPGLSGHDTLAAIRAVDSKAFVVMLSVDTAKSNIMQASQTGAQKFLKKPFSKERLLNTVKSSPYVRGIHETDTIN